MPVNPLPGGPSGIMGRPLSLPIPAMPSLITVNLPYVQITQDAMITASVGSQMNNLAIIPGNVVAFGVVLVLNPNPGPPGAGDSQMVSISFANAGGPGDWDPQIGVGVMSPGPDSPPLPGNYGTLWRLREGQWLGGYAINYGYPVPGGMTMSLYPWVRQSAMAFVL